MNKLNQMASSATKEIENEKELFPKMTWKNSWKRVSHTDVTNSIKTFVNHNRTYWNAFFNELVQLYDVSVICHLVNEGMVYEENGKVIPKPKNTAMSHFQRIIDNRIAFGGWNDDDRKCINAKIKEASHYHSLIEK